MVETDLLDGGASARAELDEEQQRRRSAEHCHLIEPTNDSGSTSGRDTSLCRSAFTYRNTSMIQHSVQSCLGITP